MSTALKRFSYQFPETLFLLQQHLHDSYKYSETFIVKEKFSILAIKKS